MPRGQVQTATIPLSGTVSDTVTIAGAQVVGIHCPVVTSCAMLVQGSYDTTSANFVRLQNPQGSGDWTFNCGPGSKGICLNANNIGQIGFPYMRVEVTIAQAAARAVTFPVKLL